MHLQLLHNEAAGETVYKSMVIETFMVVQWFRLAALSKARGVCWISGPVAKIPHAAEAILSQIQ